MSERKFKKKLEKIRKQGERNKQEYELREAYAKYAPEKKKKKVSNVMLVAIVIAIVGYAVANFYLQYNLGIEISSTLTTCWYAFWGSEIVALAAIKVTKTKHGASSSAEEYDYTQYSDDNIYADDAEM